MNAPSLAINKGRRDFQSQGKRRQYVQPWLLRGHHTQWVVCNWCPIPACPSSIPPLDWPVFSIILTWRRRVVGEKGIQWSKTQSSPTKTHVLFQTEVCLQSMESLIFLTLTLSKLHAQKQVQSKANCGTHWIQIQKSLLRECPPETFLLYSREIFQKFCCLWNVKQWKRRDLKMAQKTIKIILYWRKIKALLVLSSDNSLRPASVYLQYHQYASSLSLSASQKDCNSFPLPPLLSVSFTLFLFQKNSFSWVSSLVHELYKAKWHQMMSPAGGNDWALPEPQ